MLQTMIIILAVVVVIGLFAVASTAAKFVDLSRRLRKALAERDEERQKASEREEKLVHQVLDQGRELSQLSEGVANKHDGSEAYWKRRFESLHEVIDNVFRERDEWREMYYGSVAQHQEGVAIIEQDLVQARELFVKLLRDLNALREEHGMKPVKEPKELSDLTRPPAGQVERFHDKMREFSKRARELVARDKAFAEEHGDEGRREALRRITEQSQPTEPAS